NGFSPMDQPAESIVTVSDQIKLQLAKAGNDIDIIGGLSDKELVTMTGDTGYAAAIEKTLKSADLPADESLIKEANEAMMKMDEVMAKGESLNEESVKYMLKNELEPTIDNVYKAVFSQTGYTEAQGNTGISDADWDTLLDQANKTVADSGRTDTVNALRDARWLLENDLPLTADNLNIKSTLDEMNLSLEKEEVLSRITEAVAEGVGPKDTYLAEGYSLGDVSRVAVNILQSATPADADRVIAAGRRLTVEQLSISIQYSTAGDTSELPREVSEFAEALGDKLPAEDIKAHRVLEETRLMMTREAGVSLLKRGISIDTTELSVLVDNLRELEKAYNSPYPGVPEEEAAEDTKALTAVNKWELYIKTNDCVSELKTLPAATLGQIQNIGEATLPEIRDTGRRLVSKLAAANERYEIMQTEVRRDLGDSLQKAFGNVDDILKDLGLEVSAQNQRAVRILAYNELSVTTESVLSMRETDIKVSGMLDRMTPGVVKGLIDRGENPLDLRLDQMIEKIEEIRSEMDATSDEEGFASFLWKAEHTGEITDEQREGFIGIYRLLHQVEKSDGAVIGQLMNQGADITLRNLMGAVRTRKHENREYTIDDDFGELEQTGETSLSITQQIEVAFQTTRARDARAAMTPSKLLQFESENEYLEMDPDHFAAAMESAPADEAEEAAYLKEKQTLLREAAMSEDRIYEILRRYDEPLTGATLSAFTSYLKDTNGPLKKIFGKDEDRRRVFSGIEDEGREATIGDILDDIIEEFGESVKAPEDMAKAQLKLAEIAENVLKSSLPAADSYIDVRSMRRAVTQLRMVSDMSQKRETYAVPIMVGDELGNLSLRIVRGKDEKGLVDIVFNTDTLGTVSASFKYEEGAVNGEVTSAKNATRELLSEHAGMLAQRVFEESGISATLSFGLSDAVNSRDVYGRVPGYEDTEADQRSEVSTRRLYGIARAFISALSEM
ncbi:MAG: flagellar hook-length control protein FliK, partial [Lachnospiraceae bacterium]|nr:flagellar hook-length control protein FliK [Lachnospiraceae bacterium]